MAMKVVHFYRNDGKRWIHEGYKEFSTDDIEKTDRIKASCPVFIIHFTFDYDTEEGDGVVKISPLSVEALEHPTKGLVVLYEGESFFKQYKEA